MIAQSFARKWYEQVFRTDPIDHGKAEAAVAVAYVAAGIPEPRHSLWCVSPLDAVWAYLVLVGKSEGYNHAVYEDIERSKTGKAELAARRSSVAARLGIDEEQVEGYFGMPFYVAEGSNPITKALTADIADAWMARAQAGDDYLSAHRSGPFKPLHDLQESLHFEGFKGGSGSLMREALSKAGGQKIATLGARSAHHRLYGNLAYIEVAMDEALAASDAFEPTQLQSAIWAAYESTGFWWPCREGVVFAERPVAAVSEGPLGLRWADGFTVGQLSGGDAREERLHVSVVPPSPNVPESEILLRPLPSEHSERLAQLRAAGPLPLYDRYVAGEHEQVWAELVALGEAVRLEPHAADALAVAYETMRRVKQNVGTIADRLEQLGYKFIAPGERGGLFGLRKASEHKPHVEPSADSWQHIVELEKACGGPIPLSLRAFYEIVGEVNFLGRHASISPEDSDVLSDPLVVSGVEEAIGSVDAWDDEECLIAFAPDALHKANISGGDPYMISVPAPLADARVEGEPNDVGFVQYLRLSLAWGGFAGWATAEFQPPELKQLSAGLLAF